MSMILRSPLLVVPRCWIALAMLLSSRAAPAADAPPIKAQQSSPPTSVWARDPGIRDLKLSPDGTRIAVRYHDPEGARVAMFSVPDLKLLGAIRLDLYKSIVDVHWSGPDRLVAEIGVQAGPIEAAAATGDLFSFRYDGSSAYMLGVDARSAVYASIADPLPNDPENILLVTGRTDRARSYQTLQRFNIRSDHMTELAVAPEYGTPKFLRDAEGKVRYVNVRLESSIFKEKSWRRELDGTWTPMPEEPGATVLPVALSKDGRVLYRYVSRNGGPWCVDRQTLATGVVESLSCDPIHAAGALIRAFDGSREPIAVVTEPGRSETVVFPSGHPDRELLKLALDAFPNKRVFPQSSTTDGRIVLLRVDDDRSPGDWYLFNTVDKKIDYLLGQQEWLDPEWMGERRPLALKARDGTPLQAYLTLPPGREAKSLPLVVWPHGGPFWERDDWTFDRLPQLLATRGYAVLQVNFRGSGGYGPAFVEAGKRAWGTTMIDDLTDAVKATVASGVVDGGRICIGGWSYGGYAALMSAVREPDLYRCAIGAAGVYDLNKHLKDSDTGGSWQGRGYLTDAVAPDAESRRAASPIERLSALKAPVLIIHGGEDRRVTVGQARLLRAALEKKQHPHEVLIIDEEGHGFRKEANVQRYFDTLLAFLDRYLAPSATAAETTAAR